MKRSDWTSSCSGVFWLLKAGFWVKNSEAKERGSTASVSKPGHRQRRAAAFSWAVCEAHFVFQGFTCPFFAHIFSKSSYVFCRASMAFALVLVWLLTDTLGCAPSSPNACHLGCQPSQILALITGWRLLYFHYKQTPVTTFCISPHLRTPFSRVHAINERN